MENNDRKKVRIKQRSDNNYKPNFWSAFRQPSNFDEIVLDDPWSSKWTREPGWRKTLSDLILGGKVKEAPVEIKESKNGYQVNAEMPGVSNNDVEVQIASKNMAIRGKVKLTSGEKFIYVRSINFPEKIKVDEAKGFIEKDYLKLRVPKKKAVFESLGKNVVINK